MARLSTDPIVNILNNVAIPTLQEAPISPAQQRRNAQTQAARAARAAGAARVEQRARRQSAPIPRNRARSTSEDESEPSSDDESQEFNVQDTDEEVKYRIPRPRSKRLRHSTGSMSAIKTRRTAQQEADHNPDPNKCPYQVSPERQGTYEPVPEVTDETLQRRLPLWHDLTNPIAKEKSDSVEITSKDGTTPLHMAYADIIEYTVGVKIKQEPFPDLSTQRRRRRSEMTEVAEQAPKTRFAKVLDIKIPPKGCDHGDGVYYILIASYWERSDVVKSLKGWSRYVKQRWPPNAAYTHMLGCYYKVILSSRLVGVVKQTDARSMARFCDSYLFGAAALDFEIFNNVPNEEHRMEALKKRGMGKQKRDERDRMESILFDMLIVGKFQRDYGITAESLSLAPGDV